MSGVTARSLLVWTIVGLLVAAAMLVGTDAMIAASRAESDAVRLSGGCETVVEFPAAGVYRIAVETAGPAVDGPRVCKAVPAGERDGVVAEVILVAPDGTQARLMSDGGASEYDGPGWRRQPTGSVRVDTPGEYSVTVTGDSVGSTVVTIGADPTRARNQGLIIAAVFLGLALVAAGISIGRGRRTSDSARPRISTISGVGQASPWAPPDPADRLG